MKFTKRIYLHYVFNGNEMDLNPKSLLQRYVEILIDIKSVTGLVICVNADNSSDTVIKISCHARIVQILLVH